ncbi:MAG: hypothetical protein AB7O65_10915 [Candidatus Korobacteraceae bacterium]
MACPFFFPTERLASSLWPHPSRLPLGAGWNGRCTSAAASASPTEDELKHGCNLGYARGCPHLPKERSADAVRFGVLRDRDGRITLQYSLERAYGPAGHGMIEYDDRARAWLNRHEEDIRIQRMAECYLESYLLRRRT